MVHYGTNTSDHNEPKIIVDDIAKIGKVFQEKLEADMKIILTDFLPLDLKKSK